MKPYLIHSRFWSLPVSVLLKSFGHNTLTGICIIIILKYVVFVHLDTGLWYTIPIHGKCN